MENLNHISTGDTDHFVYPVYATAGRMCNGSEVTKCFYVEETQDGWRFTPCGFTTLAPMVKWVDKMP